MILRARAVTTKVRTARILLSAHTPVRFGRRTRMTLKTAIKKLKAEYEQATKLKWVRDPVAYSLYRVWKSADSENFRKEERREWN